jgi:hypothetical protein
MVPIKLCCINVLVGKMQRAKTGSFAMEAKPLQGERWLIAALAKSLKNEPNPLRFQRSRLKTCRER